MIVAHLDSATLARTRLAVSPLAEALNWLELTVLRTSHPVYGAPGTQARHALRDPDVALLAQVIGCRSHGSTPDLLTPTPPAGATSAVLAAQLDTVAATPADLAWRQLHDPQFSTAPLPAAVRDAAHAGTFAARAAAGLARFWRAAVADLWAALKPVLDADLAERSRALATDGMGRLLGSLHREITWTGTALLVDKPRQTQSSLADTELVLTPSALVWPYLSVQLADPGGAFLRFPVASLSTPARGPAHGLTRLLGGTRATLLHDLDVPRSTTELGRRHNLAPATVSYHLTVLHKSGLVLRNRDRHHVLYRRTDRADTLLADA
ncbi:helix-turn-helix transcriptional regulator [Solihabitans fulvus]|uniref:Helix-turn-helix transcriptional regulator n=1 Tax=Solihabitans fulvus TaxID=1892852 RepID=A0A5B2XP32_9PSEU|nr:DUF5937 family protein [Solihabitans fulvus]KAA2265113.1 helix-turn-helix transcriptional regulator [Solihabitans fulvus]